MWEADKIRSRCVSELARNHSAILLHNALLRRSDIVAKVAGAIGLHDLLTNEAIVECSMQIRFKFDFGRHFWL